jgi:hypothetical protein
MGFVSFNDEAEQYLCTAGEVEGWRDGLGEA